VVERAIGCVKDVEGRHSFLPSTSPIWEIAMNMMIPKYEYVRDKKYREWIKELRCSFCLTEYLLDPHHVKFLGGQGKGGKGKQPCDTRITPLCRPHHSLLHNWPAGEEAIWEIWSRDPKKIMETLWEIWNKDWPRLQKLEVAENFLKEQGFNNGK